MNAIVVPAVCSLASLVLWELAGSQGEVGRVEASEIILRGRGGEASRGVRLSAGPSGEFVLELLERDVQTPSITLGESDGAFVLRFGSESGAAHEFTWMPDECRFEVTRGPGRTGVGVAAWGGGRPGAKIDFRPEYPDGVFASNGPCEIGVEHDSGVLRIGEREVDERLHQHLWPAIFQIGDGETVGPWKEAD